MKRKRDSVKFIGKIMCLVVLLVAGYSKKNQSDTPANNGAVDLIIENDFDHQVIDINAQTSRNTTA